jgi:two-component system sensor histidine kinase KdpD
MSDRLLNGESESVDLRPRPRRGTQRSLRALRHALLRRWPRSGSRRQRADRRQGARETGLAVVGYLSAVLGVALCTAVVGLLLTWHVRITNISMLYLLPVLALATLFGRGPAVLASFLAFLAFDYFFVVPLHQLTVSDPFELVSLLVLLVTALVTGQLTAILRLRAREARQQERSTAILYELAQSIATGANLDALLQEMAARVVAVFAPADVEACAIVVPASDGAAEVVALEPTTGEAAQALRPTEAGPRRAAATALHGTGLSVRMSRQRADAAEPLVVHYAPLRSGDRTLGALGVAGGTAIAMRLARAQRGAERSAGPPDPLAALFNAFCGQIALAIEHAALEHAAVHAEALRESDRLKDVLLGSVTHDLRTPLAAIKAITSSLLQPGILLSDPERQELVASIDQSVDRLNHLVSNLLDLSRLEAGVAVPQRDWYLIGDVVATVLDRLDLAGQTHDRSIEVDVPGDLPLVFVDHEQLEQVVTNLVENAVKYSTPASPIQVSARVRAGATELEVRVADRGVGILAEERAAIFDKFYRAQRGQLSGAGIRVPAGSGLGLAICRAIVAAHGGRIWAECREGGGATLVFTLPLSSEMPRGELPDVVPASADASAEDAADGKTVPRTPRPQGAAT